MQIFRFDKIMQRESRCKAARQQAIPKGASSGDRSTESADSFGDQFPNTGSS